MKRPSESEIYFARKNRRREWWGKNWNKFILYPAFAAATVASVFLFLYYFSIASFQTGKRYDMKNHPQDWQHWHWETNFYYTTNIYCTNIYNRS